MGPLLLAFPTLLGPIPIDNLKLPPWDSMEIIDVQTGEICLGDANAILVSNGIGSCVVIGLLDPLECLGGMAHTMLPGRAAKKEAVGAHRYLESAVEDLIAYMVSAGAYRTRLLGFMVGAGNVLKRDDDVICKANMESAYATLSALGIPIAAQSLGGYERRRVRFEIGSAMVFCSVGDGPERLLSHLSPHEPEQPSSSMQEPLE